VKPEHSLIAANWKMQFSFTEAIEFTSEYHENFIDLSKKESTIIALCPSFPALYPLSRYFKGSEISLGAQDCSAYRSGAYTGQVCAASLAQIGCHYCIIGHSERRYYNHETSDEIAEKAQRLLEQEIQPIMCIGETKKEYEAKETFCVLEQQLEPVLTKISRFNESHEPIYIAYEPIWSIGTGIVPSVDYLIQVFEWLTSHTQKFLGKERIIGLLYGGSVSAETAADLHSIYPLSGLLVGGASLDFQKFNNIVNLYCR